MGKNLEITEKLEKYINNFSLKLNPIQQEIIDHNNTLGDVKRMQVATSQGHFLHFYQEQLVFHHQVTQVRL